MFIRRDPLMRAAIHEAGHAVAAITYGAQVTLATIRPSGDYAGRCRWKRGKASARQHIAISMAGSAAEARYLGNTWDLLRCTADCRNIDRFLRELHGSRLADWRDSPHYGVAIGLAWRVVCDHWHSIHRVADLLLARETVRHSEIVRVI